MKEVMDHVLDTLRRMAVSDGRSFELGFHFLSDGRMLFTLYEDEGLLGQFENLESAAVYLKIYTSWVDL